MPMARSRAAMRRVMAPETITLMTSATAQIIKEMLRRLFWMPSSRLACSVSRSCRYTAPMTILR